jgi:hypothetical protein
VIILTLIIIVAAVPIEVRPLEVVLVAGITMAISFGAAWRPRRSPRRCALSMACATTDLGADS